MGGSRLNWDMAKRRDRARQHGSESAFEDLPPTGSFADRARYFNRNQGKSPKPREPLKSSVNPAPLRSQSQKAGKPKQGQGTPRTTTTTQLAKCPECGALVKKLRAHITKAHPAWAATNGGEKRPKAASKKPSPMDQPKQIKAAQQVQTAKQPMPALGPEQCPFCVAKASDLHDHILEEHGSERLVQWILSR
jgi:hypothetical protein